jgi:hypothetical protein
VKYLTGAAANLCDLGFVEPEWFDWGARLFQGFNDHVAARHEQRLRKIDELAAKELDMLIDGSDESASGEVSADKVDVADMVSVHMGGSEPESEGRDGGDESDNVVEIKDDDDELVEEDSPKLKAKGKSWAKKGAKVWVSNTTGLPITKVQQGKVSSYQTSNLHSPTYSAPVRADCADCAESAQTPHGLEPVQVSPCRNLLAWT